jgi:hypothetical protein
VQSVRAEIWSAQPSRDGGLQLDFGANGKHLHGYLPGREKSRLDESLRAHCVDCDALLRKGQEVELRGRLKVKSAYNQVEKVV